MLYFMFQRDIKDRDRYKEIQYFPQLPINTGVPEEIMEEVDEVPRNLYYADANQVLKIIMGLCIFMKKLFILRNK